MKKFKMRKLRNKIFSYFFILVMMIILILDSFLLYKIQDEAKNTTGLYVYEIIKQAGSSIQSYVEYMRQVSWVLLQDEVVRKSLTQSVQTPVSYTVSSLEKFKLNANVGNDIESIIIFGTNGVTLVEDSRYIIKDYIDITQMDWYKKAIEAKGGFVVSTSHIQNYIETSTKWVFSVSRAIFDTQSQKLLGVMLVDMSYKKLADICNQITLGEEGYVYIVNKDGEIIYHPQQQLIYSDLKRENLEIVQQKENGSFVDAKDKSKIITVHTLNSIGWRVVAVTYVSEFLIFKNRMMLAVIIISIGCILLMLIVSGQIAQEVCRPISELETIMSKIEDGNLDTNLSINTTTKEIFNLSRSFQTMLLKLRRLMEEVKENEKTIRKVELKLLQAQINPHFLYNALDTIIWLGERKDHEKVVLMTSGLAKYFRLSLSKGAEIIPIINEIEHIKYYLKIQKIRYEDKLSYSLHIDPTIYEYTTIKIILQPLVENAIYHGIKDKDEGGHIRISAQKVGECIVFEVEDNGKGMTDEEVNSILTRTIPKSLTQGGVAIKNVHERIQVYFGKDYGLRYESSLGNWTKVYVTIPALID